MKYLFPIHLLKLAEVDSTNAYLQRNLNCLPSWTVVTASKQTQGKGAGGNSWESSSMQNVLMSILLKHESVNFSVFDLNRITALAVQKAVNTFISSMIKWPNDILIDTKKIAGILIENTFDSQLKSSVIGVGLNVNQTDFQLLPQATSLKNELGIHFLVDEIQRMLIINIQFFYQLLLDSPASVEALYQSNLFGLHTWRTFSTNTTNFIAYVEGVSAEGQLILRKKNGEKIFCNHKEIIWNL